jgi:hypothetical protein
MPLAGFELAIPAGELLHTHALDHEVTGIGYLGGPSFKFRARHRIL